MMSAGFVLYVGLVLLAFILGMVVERLVVNRDANAMSASTQDDGADSYGRHAA